MERSPTRWGKRPLEEMTHRMQKALAVGSRAKTLPYLMVTSLTRMMLEMQLVQSVVDRMTSKYFTERRPEELGKHAKRSVTNTLSDSRTRDTTTMRYN